jgi:tetratricopeptide (TPR) repeat protein
MTEAPTPPVSPATAVLNQVVQNLNQGDVANATVLACAALGRGTIHPLFLNLRAARFEQRGENAAALADLLHAHQIAPEDASVSNALGLAFMKSGRYFDAIGAFDAAATSAPEFASAHFNKGTAHEAAGNLDIAKTCFEQAAAIDPRAEPFARLASLAVRRGDFGEAVRLSQEALARQPGHPSALRSLITADIETGQLAGAETQLTGLLGRTGLQPFDRYMTMGLLGDLHEKKGEYGQAFAAYAQGNEEYYRVLRPQFAATAATSLQWLTAHYSSKSGIRAMPNDHSPSGEAHVFLVGFPRSGTTLLEQILSAHPMIATMEEKDAFEESVRAFMAGPESHATLATLAPDRLEHYREAYWRRIGEFGHARGGKIFVDKHPLHAVKIPLIAALFPKAKILFAIRDPRDVVLSCLRARFRMNPYMIELLRLQDAANFYSSFMRLAELYRKTFAMQIYQVRHEDLVSDFDRVSAEICTFLGVKWTSSLRDFSHRSRIRAIATPGARQIAAGLSRAGLGRWQSYADQLAPVMPVLAPWVRRFGYAA